jgi:hypothetical protein
MLDALLAAGLILLLLLAWIWVQQRARDFATRHPEFGPAKEEGSGCGTGCACTGGRCSKHDKHCH